MRKKNFDLKKDSSNENKRNHQRNRYGRKGPSRGTRQHFKKNSASLLENPELVWQKYDNLLERHLASRRKYYDYFYRTDDYKRIKMEKKFYATLEHLRRFESSLNAQRRKWLEQKTNNLKPDIIYSKNRNIPSRQEVTDPGPANPHLLPSQKEADYSQDREQSVGSIEDLQKIKKRYD